MDVLFMARWHRYMLWDVRMTQPTGSRLHKKYVIDKMKTTFFLTHSEGGESE